MAEKISSSIIDQPVTLSGMEELNQKDKFGISRYESALTKFIEQAETPLTIALQGEWVKDLDIIQCVSERVRGKLSFRFKKHTESFARMNGDDAIITIGHDDTSYNINWISISKVLWGGFGSIEEEEKLLDCPGLHDIVMKDLEGLAAKYRGNISLVIDDTYPNARGDMVGQKFASIIPHVMFRRDTLDEVISDETVQQLAEFIWELLRILFKLVPETHAPCFGHDEKIREQLKQIELKPFTIIRQWYSWTFLEGWKINGNIFGISLLLNSSGFECIIWEGLRQNTAHHEEILADLMKKYPALSAMFPKQKTGNWSWAWSSSEIIPFDSVIDWVKELQKLLISLQ